MPAPANLLLFLSGNHHRALAGCYGHRIATTPNLDRIAANGVRLANAYSASPSCCPARAAIATGRFPHQTGLFDNAIVYDGSVPSWMHRLREQGHHVAAIGELFDLEGDPGEFDNLWQDPSPARAPLRAARRAFRCHDGHERPGPERVAMY